jgi:hypothetical protein
MKKIVRRTLTVLKLTDGVWVIESTLPLHHPGASYVGEAKASLFGVFKSKQQAYSPKERARTALYDIIGGMGRNELYSLPHFHHEGVEYHPVVAPFDQFLLSSELLMGRKKTSEWKRTLLEEHPLKEKLRKRLG